MPFTAKTFSALLIAGAAVAEPLTTITPCAAAVSSSTTPSVITVTSQYQQVSTCSATSRCFRGSCSTRYPYTTWTYVSTVIPAAWNGSAATPTTVTTIDQPITVSKFSTTLTSWAMVSQSVAAHNSTFGGRYLNSTNTTTVAPISTPVYQTIARKFVVPYNEVGPLAIPGYGGSGLCTECHVKADGSRSQNVTVTDCRASGKNSPQCRKYVEVWISRPAPSTMKATAVPVSTAIVAPTTGAYTFTFPQWAPAQTYTHAQSTYTAAPSPYYVYVTKYCTRPHQTIDFTTTITKTITWTVPYSVGPAANAEPTGAGGWEDWGSSGPKAGGSLTSWAGPAHATDNPYYGNTDHWADWLTGSASSISSGATWTTSASSTTTTSTSSTTTTSTGTTSTTSANTTSITSVTTTSTTSASTTTTTSAQSTPFFIYAVKIGTKYRKHSDNYVTFENGDGFLTTTQTDAALFYLQGGYLRHGDRFVGADATEGFTPFFESLEPPKEAVVWSVNGDLLTFTGGKVDGSQAGFCVVENSILIELTSFPPFDCPEYLFYIRSQNGPTTTTTMVSTSTAATTTTSQTPDPSSDPDSEPQSKPRFRRGLTYGSSHGYKHKRN